MSWTKKQIIEAAFEEIGIASYQFDIAPEMYDVGRRRLDALMGMWNAKGIRIGYPITNNAEVGDINDDTSIPDSATEAVYQNLAIRLAPVFGKTVSPDLKLAAFQAYQAMLTKDVEVPQMQLAQTVPAGQGNKWRRNYSPQLIAPIDTPSDIDGDIDFN